MGYVGDTMGVENLMGYNGIVRGSGTTGSIVRNHGKGCGGRACLEYRMECKVRNHWIKCKYSSGISWKAVGYCGI